MLQRAIAHKKVFEGVITVKRMLVALSFTLVLGTASYASESEHPEGAAESAAVAWLILVDAGNYAGSWSAASQLFRQHVPQSQWQTAAANARAPFGALKSRKVQSATFTRSVPGAPDGEYVIVTFASSFENKASAIETVTPMMDADGTWRVSGYFIR
jgi:hypothetical protein